MNGKAVRSSGAVETRYLTLAALEKASLSVSDADRLAASAIYAVRLSIAGEALEFLFSDRAAAAMFWDKYHDHVDEQRPRFRYRVVCDAGRWWFWSKPDRAKSCPAEGLGIEQVVFLADGAGMFDFFLHSDSVALHAAVVGSESGVATIIGASTAGKTTTALACTSLGATLYSDERCVFRDGLIWRFHRALTVRPGGRALLGRETEAIDSPLATCIRQGPDNVEFSVRPSVLFDDSTDVRPAPLRAIFLLSGRGSSPQAQQVLIHTVLPELLTSMVSRDRGLARPARLLQAFKGVPVYRLQLGSPYASAAMICEILSSACPPSAVVA